VRLKREFYERENVVEIAKDLLGKQLVSSIDDTLVAGYITEVEAYSGVDDKACHANNGKRTRRTEVMFGSGGHAYVYFCYGIHHMMNVVCNVQGQADAVLIRAIQPIEGMDVMCQRRKKDRVNKNLTCGPGKVGQALGLQTKAHNGLDLMREVLWIEEAPNRMAEEVFATTRIGVDYAEEDALKPWRFYIKNSEWISKK